jgi:subtilase family serine protease
MSLSLKKLSFGLVGLMLLVLLGLPFQTLTVEAAGTDNTPNPNATQPSSQEDEAVCNKAAPGYASCHSYRHLKKDVQVNATTGIAGYDPADLQAAYNLASFSASRGGTMTVAIVDAFDDPNAEADLAVYRSKFGLPACTSTNGCFRKVNQLGLQDSFPVPDSGWSGEISLDIEMVSAICPKCHILLVEANTNSFDDLAVAVDTASSLGATAISNSYGAGEWNPGSFDAHWTHPGIAITASTGDSGYGVQYPAASTHVIAVGGTSLRKANTNRGWTESAWSGAGSGCSAYAAKPSWQKDKLCSRRTVADVSAVADPSSGVAVYNSYNSSGWGVLGGTSVAAPIIASVFALAGNTSVINDASYLYSHATSTNFWDASGGSNGSCGNYLCRGMNGFDGPTGLGTPRGVAGF